MNFYKQSYFSSPKLAFYLLLFSTMLYFISCGNNVNTGETSVASDSTVDEATGKPKASPEKLLYAWVDQLNIRDQPSTKGKKVASVGSGEVLAFTGEASAHKDLIILRGVAYQEPWLRVLTADNKEGWVFGGAVRLEGENKGNAIMNDLKFDFPHFGNFDLTGWKKVSTTDESGGDATIITTSYQQGNQVIVFSKVDVGEYGYERSYKFMDGSGKVFRERALKFMADAERKELIEIVKDYAADPPKQYTRMQLFTVHHSQLSSLPIMANGEWTESTIE